jgi:hypothetical protein
MPADELARLEREHHPLIFPQEFLAEFVDLSGVSLFSIDKLVRGRRRRDTRTCQTRKPSVRPATAGPLARLNATASPLARSSRAAPIQHRIAVAVSVAMIST